MELIDVEKLKTFLASKVTMMTDYDNGICESCIDEYIDEFIAGQQTDVQCEDAVSKETILKFLDGWMSALDENCHNQSVSDLKIIKRDFENLPPVTPKQRTGHWHITDAYPHNVYCSECHKRFAQTHWAVWEDGSLPRNFCPNCGADMREVTT